MKTYIDHFEIESQRPGEAWQHVGNVYPEYEWAIRRPWYFLWLVKRPVITNEFAAFTEVLERLVAALGALPESGECTRLTIWARRRFLGLTRVGVI